MEHDPDLAEVQSAFRSGDLGRARAIAEARLARGPDLPVLLHFLGLIHCRQGDLKSGVDWLRKAAKADPDNVAYRVMLARALIDSGRPEEAVDVAGRPAGTGPADMALWHARAEAAQSLSDHANAAQAWQVLCTARPDDWHAWANLGEALAGLERWPGATHALRKASALNPSDRRLQENLASALGRAGFPEEAADRLRALLDAGPDETGIRLTLARLFADLGRNEEAVEQLGKAAEAVIASDLSIGSGGRLIRIAIGDQKDPASIGPAELRAIRELAMLLERTNQTDGLRDLLADAARLAVDERELAYPAASLALRDENAAEAKRLLTLEDPETDPVRRHGLMAKIADRLGDSAAAFAAAQAMHKAVPDHESWRRRGADYRRHLRAKTSALTVDWAARLQPLPVGGRASPAFLVGFPRSGTTLLDTFLMGHPDVEVLEEFPMLGAADTAIGNASDLTNRRPAELERARSAYFAELDRHADRGAGRLVVDKLPLNMLGLILIRSLFPEAPIIFAQRHPCDVVLSGFMQSFVMNEAMACFLDLADAADFYDAAMDLWSQSRVLFPDMIHTSVYEQLVAEPEASLRPVIEFLGLEWRPELLDHRSTALARGAISTPSYDQVVQPLNKAPSGRWRRYEKQLEPVLPVLLPWAERLGYPD